MQIRRDYTQPFFRPPRRRRRNLLIVAVLCLLLGAAILWQRAPLEGLVAQLAGAPPTATPLPSELATRAAQLLQSGDAARAEELLQRALRQRPNDIAYRYEYGRSLLELGRAADAFEIGESIVDLDARDVRGFALQAAAQAGQGRSAQAIPLALAGLELDPRFTPLYTTLARAYVAAERWAEALEAGERGLSIRSDDPELLRAYAFAMQSVGAYGDAIGYLQRAIELRPSYLPTQFELAGLYLALDDDQSAIELYDHILAIDPRNARAMLRLCLAYRKVGEFSRALGFCEDSVANDSADAEALFQLGMLYYRERRFVESRDAFQACLEHDTGFYELSCQYRLGLSRYYTGDCAGGWSLLRDSLDLARAAGNTATLGNILLGLETIEADPACLEEAAEPSNLEA